MRLWSAILTPPLLLAAAAFGASAAKAGPDRAGPAANRIPPTTVHRPAIAQASAR